MRSPPQRSASGMSGERQKAELLRARLAQIAARPHFFLRARHRFRSPRSTAALTPPRTRRRRHRRPCRGQLDPAHRKVIARRRRIGSARSLVHVHRDHLHIGHVPFAIVRIAGQKAVRERLHIRSQRVDTAQDGKAQRGCEAAAGVWPMAEPSSGRDASIADAIAE